MSCTFYTAAIAGAVLIAADVPHPSNLTDEGDCGCTSFTFLGYTFRARNAPTRDGTSMFTGFLPAVSKDALKRMSEEVRALRRRYDPRGR